MATKKFPSELSSRGTVKTTDKLIIHNIDTGATEYTTVAELFTALANPTFTGVVQLTDATNPNFRATDTTNTVISKLQSLDSIGLVGTESNHDFEIRTNNATVAIFKVGGIPAYNDNANAAASGLTAGAFYRTGDNLKIVHA